MKIKKILLGLIILFFAIGVGYYIWHDLNKKNQLEQVEQLQQIEQSKVPNLNRPINITANLPKDAQKIAQEKIEKLNSELKQDPSLFENWLILGIYRKMIGDLEGAKECWEYAGFLSPQSPIPFNNLGDLYANYLKDSKKAEENFLIAIKNGPDQIYIYRSFYEFYRYTMKDNAKAKQILEQGISANPTTSQDLKNLLDNF
jgi:tetratricopeptide (TPR) repeat protein